jgi:hypothetical protein
MQLMHFAAQAINLTHSIQIPQVKKWLTPA